MSITTISVNRSFSLSLLLLAALAQPLAAQKYQATFQNYRVRISAYCAGERMQDEAIPVAGPSGTFTVERTCGTSTVKIEANMTVPAQVADVELKAGRFEPAAALNTRSSARYTITTTDASPSATIQLAFRPQDNPSSATPVGSGTCLDIEERLTSINAARIVDLSRDCTRALDLGPFSAAAIQQTSTTVWTSFYAGLFDSNRPTVNVEMTAVYLLDPPASTEIPTNSLTPGRATDARFVAAAGPGLDTACAARSTGPLEIGLDVSRAIAKLDSNGRLADPATLVKYGVISPTATLRIASFARRLRGATLRLDRVTLNGDPLNADASPAYLEGPSGAWNVTTFRVPVDRIRFADRVPGKPATPAANKLRIELDTDLSAAGVENWCTIVDWAELSIDALYPLILVHDNGQGDDNQGGKFWEGAQFVTTLQQRGVPYDNSISMPSDTIAAHGDFLATKVPAIAAEFGARHAHLVAHGRGGLDARDFLARSLPKNFGVLSLTTLATPHQGASTTEFNRTNLPLLPKSLTVDGEVSPVAYLSFSADMNIDNSTSAATGNPTISFDEAYGLPGQGTRPDALWASLIQSTYRLTGNVASTQAQEALTDDTRSPYLTFRTEPGASATGAGPFRDNDGVLTRESATVPPFQEVALLDANHITIASPETAARVVDSIRTIQPPITQPPAQGPLLALQSADRRTGSLAPGEPPALLAFTADPAATGTDLFDIVASREGIDITLLTPAGLEITAANAEAQGFSFATTSPLPTGPLAAPGFHTLIELPPGASPGEYRVKAASSALTAPATILATYTSSSPVRIGLAPGLRSYRPGETVILSAMLFDGSTPLTSVAATVRVRDASDLTSAETDVALDDAAIDHQTGDGVYHGSFIPPKPGRYSATLRAIGTASSGLAFSRLVTTEFVVLPELATLVELTDSAVDDTGDGIADRILLNADLKVITAGRYQLLFNLRSLAGSLPARQTATFAAGAARMSVPFSFDELARLGSNGPFSISDVALLYLGDPEAPAADLKRDGGRTQPYPVAELAAAPSRPFTLSTSSLSFGSVTAGSTNELTVTLRNNSKYAFTETSVRIEPGSFTLVSPAVPFTVQPGFEQVLRLRFAPSAAGAVNGSLAIAGLTAALSGAGLPVNPTPGPTDPPPVARIALTPSGLLFGEVVLGQSVTQILTINSTGTAPLVVQSLAFSSSVFSITGLPGPLPITIPTGQSLMLNVRFTPTSASTPLGTLTIASNAAANPSLAATLAPSRIVVVGPQQAIVQIDDGAYEGTFAVPRGTDGFYVNRLTPPAYPATLKAVRIYFGLDGPRAGASMTIVSAANPGGTAEIPPLGIRATTGWLPATGRFVDYPVPNITITSGDFLVGFAMNYDGEYGVVPVDSTEPQGRSYVSANGVNFSLSGQNSGTPKGNFPIRAVLTVGQ